ncbi:MAG: adenylate/guanylate cyclase domain-containing protein [Pirellulales bacterium]|nr:adenylate/guanylate cyclase domain-containing protein [Pirellulales bacterium]
MANLLATGIDNQQHWRRELVAGEVVRLGRAPRQGWAVPWDLSISREHADLELVEQGLRVRVLPTARNPIVYRHSKPEEFILYPGEEFQIGRTTFRYAEMESVEFSNTTYVEHTYTNSEMRAVKFKNPELCLEALCDTLRLISDSTTDEQFANRLVELILKALPNVSVVAIIQFDASADYDATQPKLMRWDSRDNMVERFQPSRQLMAKVLQRRCSVIHLWDESQGDSNFTMSGSLDWAFCTPIPTSQDRWCLYVSGQKSFESLQEIESPADLVAELRFAELTANFIGSLRRARWMEQQQRHMSQFFSPAVVEMLAHDKVASLAPREGDIAVLFCDVRGFSQKVEQSRHKLGKLLDRVSHALSAMTLNILRFEGVIADFQGDAALAFWGWPNPLEEGPVSACRAALAIHKTFMQASSDREHPLYDFQVGLALGFGHAIAGQIGSEDQTKVGVFGPVVNLTSRLESITKHIGASILIDGAMAEQVRGVLPEHEARMRRVARIRARGIETPVEIYQLIPSGSSSTQITDEQIAHYEQAAGAVTEGRWQEAAQLLEGWMPEDGPANFLRDFLAKHEGKPPQDWDGVIPLLY